MRGDGVKEVRRRLVKVLEVALMNTACGQAAGPALVRLIVDRQLDRARRELGPAVYMAKRTYSQAAARKAMVVAEFTGFNVTELARKHGVTTTRIRQILKQHRSTKKSPKTGEKP